MNQWEQCQQDWSHWRQQSWEEWWWWMRHREGCLGASKFAHFALVVEVPRGSALPPLVAMPSIATSPTGLLVIVLSLPSFAIALLAISDSYIHSFIICNPLSSPHSSSSSLLCGLLINVDSPWFLCVFVALECWFHNDGFSNLMTGCWFVNVVIAKL